MSACRALRLHFKLSTCHTNSLRQGTSNPIRLRWSTVGAPRPLHTSRRLFTEKDAKFEAAQKRVTQLKNEPDNVVKLQLYALFKQPLWSALIQAVVGECSAPKPGMIDFVGKAKWEAWTSLKGLTKGGAQQKYIALVGELSARDGGGGGGAGEQHILSEVRGNVHVITMNRPAKKNAINREMYDAIVAGLAEAANNDTTLAVITGAGNYYSSGNDLGNLAQIKPHEIPEMAKSGGEILKRFVGALIDFPKPLVALINGPAVGIVVTVLGLFDLVYASDTASIYTPFSRLGQSPEGCSTYTFPKLMGYAKASELLLFNQQLSAQQACERGLYSEVFPEESFNKEAWARVQQYAALPKQCLTLSKNLLRERERATLHGVNAEECDLLMRQWQSDECREAITAFFLNRR